MISVFKDSHSRQVSMSKKEEAVMFAFLLDVILFIFVLVLYYAFLMSPAIVKLDLVRPPSARKGSLVYSENIDLAKKFIQVSGQTWKIVLDPDLYSFDSKKISLKHPCDNKPKGTWILAKPKDIYRHTFLKGQLLQHERTTVTTEAVVDTLNGSVDYFYECGGGGDEKYHRLRQCPLGTNFVRGQCFASSVCKFKKNHYKYTIRGLAETDYYECLNKEETGPKTCPPGQIFRFVRCDKPKDPCHLEKDGHVIDSGTDFYKFCRKGLTVTRYCGLNEYFHSSIGRCVPDTCRGKPDGAVLAGQTVTDSTSSRNNWQYIKKYEVCRGGIVEKRETCTRISQDETFDGDVDLPRFKVFNPKTATCEVPKFGVNITTSSGNVGRTLFRRLMANYEHSELYDLLNGYTHDKQQQQQQHMIVVATPGKLVNDKSVCDYDKTKTKFPIYGEWNRFFDCVTNNPQDCQTTDEIFDYGSQKCVSRKDSESFHKFDGQLPVFKFKELHYNWIKPRPVRLRNLVTVCDDPLVYDETYDICVDKKCQGYEFLSQLANTTSSSVSPPFILADDFHQCVFDKSSRTVRYVPYQKPYNVQLDFWRQTFVPLSRSIVSCEKGKTRLSTSNFVMNATVWPTCNLLNDLSLDKPFVFCPSTGLDHISMTMPTLCIPLENVLKIDLLADEWYYVHITEFHFLHTLEKNTSIGYKFSPTIAKRNRTYRCHSVGNYSFNDITTLSFPKNYHYFYITVDKNAQLWRYRVPTNHPEYVVDEEGNPSHENFDLFKMVDQMKDSKFTNVKDAKFVFENYSIDPESLTGFS